MRFSFDVFLNHFRDSFPLGLNNESKQLSTNINNSQWNKTMEHLHWIWILQLRFEVISYFVYEVMWEYLNIIIHQILYNNVLYSGRLNILISSDRFNLILSVINAYIYINKGEETLILIFLNIVLILQRKLNLCKNGIKCKICRVIGNLVSLVLNIFCLV